MLKRKNMYFGRKSFYFGFFLSKSYVLDHSESLLICILKSDLRTMFVRCPLKTEGGGQNFVYMRKMPDQHKYKEKRISASYKMFRKVIEILILSFNYFKLSIS